VCGDGWLNGSEECDDSNATSGDGCSATCQLEDGWYCNALSCAPQVCGNGVRDATEECDDGNDEPGDGCFDCKREPSSCVQLPI
jgi:cysteine-rich repeat protein